MAVLTAAAGSPELLKMLAAAHSAGVKIAVDIDGLNPGAKLRTSCGDTISDANAAALFLSASPKADLQLQPQALAVEEWVAWDSRVLVPALRKALAEHAESHSAANEATGTHGDSDSDLVAAVHHVDRALAARPAASTERGAPAGIVSSALSVADIVIAVDLLQVVNHAALHRRLQARSPAVFAHVAAVTAQPLFQTALKAAAQASAASTGAGTGRSKVCVLVDAAGALAAGVSVASAASAAPSVAAATASVLPTVGTAALAATDLTTLDSGVVVAVDDVKRLLMPVDRQLTCILTRALHATCAAAASIGLPAQVEAQTNPRYLHHYQCSLGVKTVGQLRKLPGAPTNAKAVAEAVVAAVQADSPRSPLIGKLEVSSAGAIYITLATDYLSARVADILRYGLRATPPATVRNVLVDYSSPNIAKDMHIGHLRSTIIGDTLARLLEFSGHDVMRVNHVGDWGTQFGMLIAHLKDVTAAGASIDVGIGDLTVFYKAAKQRFDAEPAFKERAHKEVVALQAGDPSNRALWQQMVDVSQVMFNEVYNRLDVDKRLLLRGESFYNDMVADTIADVASKGLASTLAATADGGAQVVMVPGQEVPLFLRKSDGGVGYDSTDLAALRYRLFTLRRDWLVYVVDSGQSLHFDLVFATGRMAGWYAPDVAPAGAVPAAAPAAAAAGGAGATGGAGAASGAVTVPAGAASGVAARVQHCGFGVIQGEDRKKFKTRSGDTVRLVDVLDEARDRAKKGLLDRLASAGAGTVTVKAEDVEHAAAVLGYGGVKYFDLRQHRITDYVFSYERMLSPDGDTAVYLEYAHARVCSILRKAAESGIDVPAILAPDSSAAGAPGLTCFTHPTELAVVAQLVRFQTALTLAVEELTPHVLCEFVYAVANRTAEFHRDCNVLGATTPPHVRASRLRMIAAMRDTIATVLRLLGITPLDRI